MATTTMDKIEKTGGTLRSDVLAVLKLIDDFGALLTAETAALRKSDYKSVDSLQAAKRQYASDYQKKVSALLPRKAEIATLDMPLRQQLVMKRTGFTVTLDENLRALEAAKASATRLVGKILDAARKSVVEEKQTNYSSKGKAQAYKTSTRSLTVDQKL